MRKMRALQNRFNEARANGFMPDLHPLQAPAAPAVEDGPYVPTTVEWRALIAARAELASRLGMKPEALTNLYATVDRVSDANTNKRRWRGRGAGVEAVVAVEDGSQLVGFAGSSEGSTPVLNAGDAYVFARSEPHRKPPTPSNLSWQTALQFVLPTAGKETDGAANGGAAAPPRRARQMTVSFQSS